MVLAHLPVETPGKNVNRPTFGIVAEVDDELIVEGEARRGGPAVAVIGLENLLGPGILQLADADQDTQVTGVEKRLVDAGNAVDDPDDANAII